MKTRFYSLTQPAKGKGMRYDLAGSYGLPFL